MSFGFGDFPPVPIGTFSDTKGCRARQKWVCDKQSRAKWCTQPTHLSTRLSDKSGCSVVTLRAVWCCPSNIRAGKVENVGAGALSRFVGVPPACQNGVLIGSGFVHEARATVFVCSTYI